MATNIQAQVYTYDLTVGPKSINQLGAFGPDATVPTATLQGVDTAPLLVDDQQRAKLGLPARLGVDVPANVDLLLAGVKSDKPGYRVSIYQFNIPDALGLSVTFDELQLAEGARLFIYNKDQTKLIGPITARQNGPGFWSDLLEGSSVLVEVQESDQLVGQSRVHVAKLVQYYRFAPRFGFGTSQSCELNTICYPAYQNEADGVCMMLTNYTPYTYACTGSIVNTAQQSFRSYLLTAFHCYDFSGDGVQSAGELAAAASTQFRFHWESPTCTPTSADNVYLTLTGANFRSAYAASDFTLMELTQQVPPSENITYLGWNWESAVPNTPFGIHHPSADIKKISFSPNNTSLVNVTPGASYIVNQGSTHIQVVWGNQGVTEGGSSGSPLFDTNRRIVGQLHGGGSYCTATTSPDQYGRLFTSWTGGATNATRLSNWLDATNLGNTTTDGVKPAISGSATITNSGSFSINTVSASITSWSIAGGTGVVSTTSGTGNLASLDVLTSASSLTITFSVSAGQTYPITFSKVFDAISTAPDLTPALTARPSTVRSTTAISVVVDVYEINAVATSGTTTVRLTKDPKVTLNFDNSLTSVGGKSVQNSAWSFSGPAGGFYTLTTNQVISAGGLLSFGLNGLLNPGTTTGSLSISATVLQPNETNLENNIDADKIEYFQQ
ncbi:hypothetical protein [Spirosoma koreense]